MCTGFFAAGSLRNVIVLLFLFLISVKDLQKKIIPNSLVLLLFLWVSFWQFLFPCFSHWSSLAGFLAGGGFFYLIAFLSKGGLGAGDIKLAAVLGLATGWPSVFLVFMLAFVSGAVIGIMLLLFKKKTWRTALPFAPFLSLAYFLTAFWGQEIWQWYLSFL